MKLGGHLAAGEQLIRAPLRRVGSIFRMVKADGRSRLLRALQGSGCEIGPPGEGEGSTPHGEWLDSKGGGGDPGVASNGAAVLAGRLGVVPAH